jgi:Protein of unknown function (DUF2950)
MSGIGTRHKRHEDEMIRANRTRAAVLWWSPSTGLILSVTMFAVGALSSGGAAAAGQKTFASPEAAADALAAAWRSGSKRELLVIFGPEGERLVSSGDPVAEKQARERLASSYAEEHRLETEGARKVVIILGKDEWPYPIPLVRQGTGWRFDLNAGAEQIIERRIGRNELNAIEVCRAYVEAQRDFAAKDRLSDGLHEYARRVVSSEGKHDGLYWPTSQGEEEGEEESPLGPLVAAAEAQGYSAASAEGQAPFHGYFYRILTRQGKSVPGGAQDYVVNRHLTGGFALVGFPAKYGDSGVMTFVVNQNGIVFEKNLGPNTADIARHMTDYNPDQTWKIAQP